MMNNNELITAYETDVAFPDVSGMEHLDMLMTRSEIAQHDAHMSNEEWQRVLSADRDLQRQAKQFYTAIQKIADLADWRRQQNMPATHWWWYLDTIIQLPPRLEKSSRRTTIAPQFVHA